MDAQLEAEFPVVDPRMVGRRYRELLCISRSPGRSVDLPGWDRLTAVDVEDGSVQSYCFGDDWMVEEHVYAPNAERPESEARWIVGTALNLRTARTVLSVFAAGAIQEGPVAQAMLPYALPIGLHGTFRAGS
jgi:carotenoid cleavage dioxygenase